MTKGYTETKNIFLADDDIIDCILFKLAIKELSIKTNLTITSDGMHLMETLDKNTSSVPHVIFLNLDILSKNGIECLKEIRQHEILKTIPVIIYTNSYSTDVADITYDLGANYYITKPVKYQLLVKVIETALFSTLIEKCKQPPREKYCLTVN